MHGFMSKWSVSPVPSVVAALLRPTEALLLTPLAFAPAISHCACVLPDLTDLELLLLRSFKVHGHFPV